MLTIKSEIDVYNTSEYMACIIPENMAYNMSEHLAYNTSENALEKQFQKKFQKKQIFQKKYLHFILSFVIIAFVE